MSDQHDNLFDSELIDLHLGHVAPERSEALRRRIAADADLARQNDELTGVFAALASIRQPAAIPPGLIERLMRRVGSQPADPAADRSPLRVVPDRARTATLAGFSFDAPRLFARVTTLRDVLAVAATIVLLIGLGVPSLLHVRERSQRVGCSANLARLGQGLAAYATVFNDSLPFAGWSRNASWQSTSDVGMRRVANRMHVYRLLSAGTVDDPTRFICPSRADVPMTPRQVRASNDFLEARNVSYGYQNMAGVRPTLNDNPDLPIMADDNPLFDDGLPLGLSYGPSFNSRSHGGAGQNVLTLGGRVRWMTTPDCGVDGDNIWTLREVKTYTGREGPAAATDAHLLK